MKKLAFLLVCVMLLSVLPFSTSAHGEEIGVSAAHAILYEPATDTILFEKDKDVSAPMASTTKIMTAYVALKYGNLGDVVTISQDACGIEGSSIYMEPGEQLSLEQLLYALLLQSANDAAAAIALHVGGTVEHFVEMMNEEAGQLGLLNTHFENPHGLDSPGHFTTAYDLAKLTAIALENDIFSKIVKTTRHSIPKGNDGDVRVLINHNKLLRMYDGAVGVKTGFTKKSGRCLVGAAEQNGLTLITVTLDAPSDWNDHTRLFDYGFSKMENRLICKEESFTFALPIWGRDEMGYCTNVEPLYAILPKDADTPTYTISLPHYLTSPLKSGCVVGNLHFSHNGTSIGDIPLVIK